MSGGRLVIHGRAGHHLGGAYAGSRQGMQGGEIIVHGGAGDEAGSAMRRGLIAIGGDCGDFAGAGMLAGTLIGLGRLGARPGAEMRRGTLVALSDKGRALIDAAVTAHVANEADVLSALTRAGQKELQRLVGKLIGGMGPSPLPAGERS